MLELKSKTLKFKLQFFLIITFLFLEVGTSYFPCSEIYHGADKFSEPETR